MSTPLLKNFAKSVLEHAISMADTTLQITPADADLFPEPTGDEEFRVILWDGVNDPEIVTVTDNTAGLFTIVRAQEGTAARAWDAYTQVRHEITAGIFQYFLDAVAMLSAVSVTSNAIGLGSKTFEVQANKLFPPGQWVLILSENDPTEDWMLAQVDSYSGTTLSVTVVQINGSGTHTDWKIVVSAPPGEQGADGAPGAAGATGAAGQDGLPGVNGKTILNGAGAPGAGLGANGDFYIDTSAEEIYGPKAAGVWGSGTSLIGSTGATGVSPGKQWVFSTTTTDADPTDGKVRANNATFASITKLFFDNLDAAGVDSQAWLDRLDDSTNSGDKGLLRLAKATDPEVFMEFQVTGAVVDDTGYREVPVTPIAGDVPADATVLVVEFSMTGDAGTTFLALSDTPADFTGDALKPLRVNAAEDAVEFGPVPRGVTSVASSATPTPNADTTKQYNLTALAANAVFGAPTGTPEDGQELRIRIKDNSTVRTLGWNAIYRASPDLALPTTTVDDKTMYLQFLYNDADTKWDFVAYLDNF